MADLIDRHPEPGYRRTADPFRTLVSSIVSQQLSTKAAQTIHGRFLALWPDRDHPCPADLIAADHDHLRSAGLSGAKALALVDLATKIEQGELDFEGIDDLCDDDVRTKLVRVRGIGPWSADMFMMFGLTRPDILPLGDLGIRTAILRMESKEAMSPEEMEARAEPWRPYRTHASWYLWRSLEDKPPRDCTNR